MNKKLLLVVLILLALISTSCSKENEETTFSSNGEPIYIDYLEKPKDNTTPLDYSVLDNIRIAYGVILDNPYFKSVTTGTAITDMVIKNKQTIYSSKVVNGNKILFESITTSDFKNEAIQRYYNGNSVNMRYGKITSTTTANWESEYEVYDYDYFSEKLGFTPNIMTGYIINDESILDYEIIDSNYFYTVRITLDSSVACMNTKHEVKFNAGALDLPKYSKTELTISLNEDWLPQEIIMHDIYKLKVKVGFTVNAPVDATLTEKFYYDDVEIPDEYNNIFI
ncbi:MAG: hypothetical protein IJA65_00400 [Acholeplasmatales bacterium]|nr:hypothetical protein [Acholeplasmatales bacterium]